MHSLRKILTILALFVSNGVFAYDVELGGIYYNLNQTDKTAEVTYKKQLEPTESYKGNITIPDIIYYLGEKYIITDVGDYAFYNCNSLTNITMPKSVKAIGSSAFTLCEKLECLELPYGISTIENSSFSSCTSLTSFSIPNSVTKIGDYAFSGCVLLSSLIMSQNVSSIGIQAFCGCESLESISMPAVTIIGDYAFLDCMNITSFLLPDCLEIIGKGAFLNCERIQTIKIPSNVYRIGTSVVGIRDGNPFIGCSSLTSITVDSRNVFFDSRDNCNAIIRTSENSLIAGCHNTIIPNSVTSINFYAFSRCGSLKTITLPNSLKKIDDSAFSGCNNLSTVISEIEHPFSLGVEAFYGIPSNSVLYVPKGTISSYMYNGWNKYFSQIQEISNQQLTLSIMASGNGNVNYNGITVRNSTKSFSLEESSAIITITPDNGYRIKALKKNGSTVLTNYSGSYQYTVSNISANTTVAVEFEAIPTTSYTLTIIAKGNGYVSYYGSNIRNESRSFNVNAGATFTISFAPDKGYFIMSVTANNADITSIVYDNKHTINNVNKDLTIEVTFSGYSGDECSVLLEQLAERLEQVKQRLWAIVDKINTDYYADLQYRGYPAFIVQIQSDISRLNDYGTSIKEDIAQTGCNSDVENKLLIFSDDLTRITGEVDKLEEETSALNKELYDTMVNAISSLRSELVDVKASIVDNKYVKAFFEDDIKTIQKDIDALDELVRTDKKLWYQGTFQPKEASIRTALDKLSTNSQKPSLVIGAKGNGYVLINNKYIRNDTILIHDEGAQMFAQYVPDYGNRVKYVKLNYVVITPNNPGQYYIEDIKPGTTFEVEFEEELTSFAYNGMSYKVSSSEDRTIVLSIAGTGKVVEVPAKINYQGAEWKVMGVEKEAFVGNDELAAIIWQPNATFNATVNNPNLLLYVGNISNAPASVKNVVVNGMATSISLMDASSGNEFYCPQEFVAQSIQYSHCYSMETGMGEAKGWETIVLPFDVDRVTHESKGRIWPFAKWRDGYGARPFWLMQLDSNGWKEAESIKANTPYIISMPNHESYLDDYLLNGVVTFSAENATVRKSDAMQTASYKDRTFVPTYAEVGMSEGAYALNVNNDVETNISGVADGSTFVQNLRKVHPFEAYMTTTRATRSLDISEGMGIVVNNGDEERISVYNMKGMMMKTSTGDSMEEIRRSLPAGVYIINKRKVLVK